MDWKCEKRIGQNIRKIREQKMITQENLSAKMQINGCDITRSALAKIEVGQRHIYVDELILLKQLLEVSFDELLKQDTQTDIRGEFHGIL